MGSFCLGIDVDAAALAIAKENLEEADIEKQVDFVLADVAELNNASPLLERLKGKIAHGLCERMSSF